MQTLLEPFSQAYYFGRERVSSRYMTSPIQADASFSDVKTLCELSYPGQLTKYFVVQLYLSPASKLKIGPVGEQVPN